MSYLILVPRVLFDLGIEKNSQPSLCFHTCTATSVITLTLIAVFLTAALKNSFANIYHAESGA